MVLSKESIVNRTKSVALITTVSLVSIGIIQIIIGEILSRSVSLVANGFDCIGDGFVSGIVWGGLRFFKKPADQRFHFGYYKLENLASIAATIVMFFLAGYIFYRSYNQLVNPEEVQLPFIGALLAFIAGLIAISLGLYKMIKFKTTSMSSVKLDAFNTIKDGTTSFLTVAALVLSWYGYTIADSIIGFIIAGFIVTIGFAAVKEAGYMLLDACDGDCMMYSVLIKTYAERVKGVKSAQIVRLRRTGPVIQGELEIMVPGEMTVSELNRVQANIIKIATEKISELERLTITVVPFEKEEK
jgi:ferrous-iron efflux pump FieF